MVDYYVHLKEKNDIVQFVCTLIIFYILIWGNLFTREEKSGPPLQRKYNLKVQKRVKIKKKHTLPPLKIGENVMLTSIFLFCLNTKK